MESTSARLADDIEHAVQEHGDRLFRICLVLLGNERDAEDAVQETILKYILKAPAFEGREHEKAWLIRVATNQCRDMQRFRLRHPQVNLEELNNYAQDARDCEVFDALMRIPPKFRLVMILHYVEGYRTEEIARMIGKSASAVKMRLQKGRKLLAEEYGKEQMEYE